MLFQWEVGKHSPEEVVSAFSHEHDAAAASPRFAISLFQGTVSEISALDELVREQSQNWRMERMAAVDRNVLRMAVYELLHLDTPPAVVINEALEIVRRFSGEEGVEFVNGVLDGIRTTLPARGSRPEPGPAASGRTSARKRGASRAKGDCEK
jgi:N utilization substance protein B